MHRYLCTRAHNTIEIIGPINLDSREHKHLDLVDIKMEFEEIGGPSPVDIFATTIKVWQFIYCKTSNPR